MNHKTHSISPARFDAVIFDLDGVVTRTARIHADTWQRLFEDFRREWTEAGKPPFEPYEERDYLEHIDGRPRYDGVKAFLESRGVQLDWGSPGDPIDAQTVCGLGNRKNQFFLRELEERAVEPYQTTIDFIQALRRNGFKTAIISSSKNCAAVLKSAGATHLFDAVVDGLESARIGIKGKPAPDIFLEAARRIGVEPSRAVVVEDAISGVQAGRAGGFGRVIGVNRGGDPARLSNNGANLVVSDLGEVGVETATDARELPWALEHTDQLLGLPDRRLAIFLDYDGTLTPIVPRPEDAVLAPEVRRTVAELARLCPVAIISGRDLADVRRLVGVEGIVYAGSHGFDIAGPQGTVKGGGERDRFLPLLATAERELTEALSAIPGSQLERKKYSIAVHYRNVADPDLGAVEAAVAQALDRHPTLRDLPGKKVHDLQPRIDWDKGKALIQVLGILGLDGPEVLPIYIGDDLTDEDAFVSLQGRGLGIVVRDEPRRTAASLALDSPQDVHRLLSALRDRLRQQPA